MENCSTGSKIMSKTNINKAQTIFLYLPLKTYLTTPQSGHGGFKRDKVDGSY